MGLSVTAMPQCDRNTPALSGGQKGFISFVVKPTFDALVAFSNAVLNSEGSSSEGLKSTIVNIVDNIGFWKQVQFYLYLWLRVYLTCGVYRWMRKCRLMICRRCVCRQTCL